MRFPQEVLRNIVLIAVWAASGLAGPVSAQQCESLFDNRNISLVVPYSAGGGYDNYARVFAPVLESSIGAKVRIRNLPGAGAMIGINAVANARSSELIIGLFSPTILHNEKIYGRSAPDISSFEPLGSFYSDSTVWATRDEVNVDFNDAEGRFFAVASNSDFNRILLPGFALDWNIHLVRGYAGSTDQVFALLRRDVDYIYSSSVSMANYIESTEGINVFISVSDGPNSIFPDVPYLAGTGGVVEQLTNDLPAEQQRERIILARLSSELGKTYRAVMISSNADSEQVVCLRNAVEGAMFSEEFRQRAIAQHLLVEPLSGSALGSVIAETDSLIEDNWRLLQKYMEKSQ